MEPLTETSPCLIMRSDEAAVRRRLSVTPSRLRITTRRA